MNINSDLVADVQGRASPSHAKAPPKKRAKRDVSDDPDIHPRVKRMSELYPEDQNILFNPLDGDRLDWKNKFLRQDLLPEAMVISDNAIVSQEFFNDLPNNISVTYRCPECRGDLDLEWRGYSGTAGKYPSFECRNSKCKFRHANEPKYCKEPQSTHLPIRLAKSLFSCLLGQLTYVIFKQLFQGQGLSVPGESYFHKICTTIYKVYGNVFEEILQKNRNSVKEFYLRRGVKLNDDGKMDITISCDGAYTRRSHNRVYLSRYCLAFAIEAYTGTVIDVVVVERCTDNDCYRANGNICPNKKHHGTAKTLEPAAVLQLYIRSDKADFPFRYTIYIGDADSGVFSKIIQFRPEIYGAEGIISKQECVFHYRKRAKVNLYGIFLNFKTRVVRKPTIDRYLRLGQQINYEELTSDDFKGPITLWNKDMAETLSIRYANLIFFVLKSITRKFKNSDSGSAVKAMSHGIMAIPRHHCDFRGATLEMRNEKFHKYCSDSFCKFLQMDERERHLYEPTKDGLFHIEEFDALGKLTSVGVDAIIGKFDELADEETMGRCTLFLHQNTNESIHQRYFNIVSKSKSFQYPHLDFAAKMAAAIHNVGYECGIGVIYTRMGEYRESEKNTLQDRDKKRETHASEEHREQKNKSRFDPTKTAAINQCGPNEADYEPGVHNPTAALKQKCDNDQIDLESGVEYEHVTPEEVEDFEASLEVTYEGVKNDVDVEAPLSCVTFGRYRKYPDPRDQQS